MDDAGIQFTVFTPTRNRAHTLHRVYDSLREQTFRGFEWLIVDNASTDNTADLIESWRQLAEFPIRYIRQENAGVHGSWNRGVAEARGRLLLEIRSADSFVPTALERFDALWRGIPEAERAAFVGVTVNCVDELGRLIGTEFPAAVLDSDSSEIRFRYKVRGEKWGFQRIEIMRDHPMPLIEGYLGYVPNPSSGAPSHATTRRAMSMSACGSTGRIKRTGCRDHGSRRVPRAAFSRLRCS